MVKRYVGMIQDNDSTGPYAANVVLADDYEQLQADNARLRKDYEEGLEAWKVNSTWHAGWCERFMKELDKYRDAWEPDFSPVSQAMAEYKAARAGR